MNPLLPLSVLALIVVFAWSQRSWQIGVAMTTTYLLSLWMASP